MGIASVGFDINVCPRVTPVNSPESKAHFTEALNGHARSNSIALPAQEHIDALLARAMAATFGLQLPGIVVTISYTSGSPPTVVTGALAGALSINAVTTAGQNLLTVQLVSAQISIPSNPAIEQLLNNAFVPQLIPYINSAVLGPIKIPALQFQSLQVSLPVPAVQQPNVLAYAALGSIQPDVPPPASWPPGCVFVGADAALITAAAGIPFPLGPSTGFSWDIVSGQVEAQVHAPTNITINSDGSVSATIVADALAQLTLHTPDGLPNVNFGPRAVVSLSATLKPLVVGGQLCMILEGIPIPTFSFDWGIPSWINWLFIPIEAGLAAALNAILGPLIGHVLSLPPIPVWTIPPVSFDLGGKTIGINLNSANAIGANNLLVVRANVTVS
jgi:hypothetical protein